MCALNPTPTWQLRARNITQDLENKRIEYTDATLDFMGLPILYMPYFSNADPSVKRQSGFLIPNIGTDSNLGAFASLPYYWVIDGQSDATFTPTVAAKAGPQIAVEYRRDFNFGDLKLNGAATSVLRTTGCRDISSESGISRSTTPGATASISIWAARSPICAISRCRVMARLF